MIDAIEKYNGSFPQGKWIRIEWGASNFYRYKQFNFHGIYVIFAKNPYECLYIGCSKKVGWRLWRHLGKQGVLSIGKRKEYFPNGIIIAFRRDKKLFEHKMLEARLIYRILPRLNKRN